MALISSSRRTVQTFLSEATALGIRVPHILELNTRLRNGPVQVEGFLKKIIRQGMDSGRRPVVGWLQLRRRGRENPSETAPAT